jgi:hypothetical protein
MARQGARAPERIEKDSKIRGLLDRLSALKGCTSLIVTHDSRIMNQADRIIEMDRGEIKVNVIVAERMFIYRALRMCPAFAAVLPEQLIVLADQFSIGLPPDVPASDERLQKQTRAELFQPGELIMKQGAPTGPDSRFYVIREGTVSVRQDRGSGETEAIRLRAGDFFGDRAIIKYDERNATVTAVDRVVCYAFPFGKLREHSNLNWDTVHAFIRRFIDVYGAEGGRVHPPASPV